MNDDFRVCVSEATRWSRAAERDTVIRGPQRFSTLAGLLGPLHTTVTCPDAWGRVRSIEIEWLPEMWAGPADEAFSLVWGDLEHPPVFLARARSGGVVMRRSIVRVSEETEEIFEAVRVRDDRILTEPGTYRILAENL